jgi:hypothetical protein
VLPPFWEPEPPVAVEVELLAPWAPEPLPPAAAVAVADAAADAAAVGSATSGPAATADAARALGIQLVLSVNMAGEGSLTAAARPPD